MASKAQPTVQAAQARLRQLTNPQTTTVHQWHMQPVSVHRHIGNQCVQHLQGERMVQAKLAINQPSDIYEQEADRVADQVMRMPDLGNAPLQRACACGGFAGPDSECEACKAQHLGLQRRPANNTSDAEATTAPQIVHDVIGSASQPLDSTTRAFFEPRFGVDFSAVRVHADGQAADSARAVNALAYTVADTIVFGSGQYEPNTSVGQKLLAHELTHVIQQQDHPRVTTEVRNFGVLQRQGFGELRVAEACYSDESRIDDSPVDGEFWTLPPGVPKDSVPVFDDEDTQVIVGFRTGGSVTKVYALDGTLVEINEPGLESPLIDPIDILAGGIVGLGRGLIGGGLRAGARGAAARGGAVVLGRAGLRAAVSTLGRRTITAVRGVYRAIRFRGALNFTTATTAHMANVARRVPHHILKLAIRFGTRTPDPQGVVGAFHYTIPMFRNGTEYALEVVIREADQTVLHFLYR